MSKVIKDKKRIYVRYRQFNEDGAEIKEKTKWLAARVENRYSKSPKWTYELAYYKSGAFNWMSRYGGDLEKTIDMARKLAQIVKVGRDLIENEGYAYDLVLVREVTTKTEVSLTDNPMVTIAVAAL